MAGGGARAPAGRTGAVLGQSSVSGKPAIARPRMIWPRRGLNPQQSIFRDAMNETWESLMVRMVAHARRGKQRTF